MVAGCWLLCVAGVQKCKMAGAVAEIRGRDDERKGQFRRRQDDVPRAAAALAIAYLAHKSKRSKDTHGAGCMAAAA